MTQLCRRGRGLACSLLRPASFLVAALWPGSPLRSWCVLRKLILGSPSNASRSLYTVASRVTPAGWSSRPGFPS